jgi:putative ABC transport system ATP-binding protein
MDSNSFIQLNNVSKKYHKGNETVNVLEGVNLQINNGEFISLMGPSGSGKSTLLNLLGGLDILDTGEVIVDKQAIMHYSENQLCHWRAKNVGFIFQFYNLLPGLTALQNVQLPLLLKDISASERKRKAEIALEVVGLKNRADHYPSELSGGQEQRVAIARALVTDPKILLADEPTGDLDRETADEILALLSALNKEYNKTIIMVTHDPQAASIATRHIIMDKGRLVETKYSAVAA